MVRVALHFNHLFLLQTHLVLGTTDPMDLSWMNVLPSNTIMGFPLRDVTNSAPESTFNEMDKERKIKQNKDKWNKT